MFLKKEVIKYDLPEHSKNGLTFWNVLMYFSIL